MHALHTRATPLPPCRAQLQAHPHTQVRLEEAVGIARSRARTSPPAIQSGTLQTMRGAFDGSLHHPTIQQQTQPAFPRLAHPTTTECRRSREQRPLRTLASLQHGLHSADPVRKCRMLLRHHPLDQQATKTIRGLFEHFETLSPNVQSTTQTAVKQRDQRSPEQTLLPSPLCGHSLPRAPRAAESRVAQGRAKRAEPGAFTRDAEPGRECLARARVAYRKERLAQPCQMECPLVGHLDPRVEHEPRAAHPQGTRRPRAQHLLVPPARGVKTKVVDTETHHLPELSEAQCEGVLVAKIMLDAFDVPSHPSSKVPLLRLFVAGLDLHLLLRVP